MAYGGQPHEVKFDLWHQGQGHISKWAKTNLLLPQKLRYVLGTISKWAVGINLVKLDLTSDLEV